MAAGAVGLVLFFYFWNRRRVAVVVPQRPARAPLVREPLVYDSRQYDDPRLPPP